MSPERAGLLLALSMLAGCGHVRSRQVIVIGVDGMDPGFVEAHWAGLPNLNELRQTGRFSRLATTTPPQSPVAWSTFATGLEPAEHGIFDFVHRDPVTREPYLSTDRTLGPKFQIALGPYLLPLSSSHVISLRKGQPFWRSLSEKGIPVTVIRMPANYPPSPFGNALSGMETPDLRGTSSTFTFFTDDPDEVSRNVSGGMIRKVDVSQEHVTLRIEGPPNSLRKDRQFAAFNARVDIDPTQPYARIRAGHTDVILKQGEWSEWIQVEFPLVPHLASAHGIIRFYAKQLHPRFEMYVSPVNVDPTRPNLPISQPAGFSGKLAEQIGPYYTVGIPEDTSAMRQGVFDLREFLAQSNLVLTDERKLFDNSLATFHDGFLFFYFSSIDQNSHMLWGKHDADLLKIYQTVDDCVGKARVRFPNADLIVMSDHGFTTFSRAVHLNRWLADRGFAKKAYAIGLNALYVTDRSIDSNLRAQLLSWRDPVDGRQIVKALTSVHPSAANRTVAPDFIVGYAPGYRASWQTGLGESAAVELEDNNDAWIADHCIDPADVPGVLFTSWKIRLHDPSLKNLSGVIMDLYARQNRP